MKSTTKSARLDMPLPIRLVEPPPAHRADATVATLRELHRELCDVVNQAGGELFALTVSTDAEHASLYHAHLAILQVLAEMRFALSCDSSEVRP